MSRRHQLWVDPEGLDTFCLAGPEGDEARALLQSGSKLEWEVEASSHFEAMTKYYLYRGYGVYITDFPEHDSVPYDDLRP